MKLKKIAFIIGIIVTLASVGVLTGRMYAGSAICGNTICEVGETQASCVEDCFSICGDAICQEGEALVCPDDCTGDYEISAPKQVSLLDGIISWLT